MSDVQTPNPIPRGVARRLCNEIRHENRGKWHTFRGLWCWGCAAFTKGDPEKMCWNNKPGHRGCAQVNARYDQTVVHHSS
jgi:hypothetical protein